MRVRTRLAITLTIVFIISTIISVTILLNGDDFLVKFYILNVTNNLTDYNVEFSKVKAADHYVIQLHDSSNRKVFETYTKDTKTTLSLTNLSYGEEYSMMVFAYDKGGDFRPAEEPYIFKWNQPNFNKDASIILNNEDYNLLINGEFSEKKYSIVIKSNGETIEKNKLNENEYLIKKELYENQEKELEVLLMYEKSIIDKIKLFNNINPVTDLKIKTPKTEATLPYNDFTLAYDGGENSKEFIITITKDGKKIKETNTTKSTVIFSKNIFSVGNTYEIEVKATYDDYNKSDKVTVTMSNEIQLMPVYISSNWRYMKKGTKVSLSHPDKDAKIYYTLDGKNPESNGIPYTEPIEINENVKLKCVAMSEGKQNSIVTTYDINVGVKEKLVVYLSPSNQHKNLGVESVGYTNEMAEMNDLTNYIQERLESYNVKVYRNSPAGNINQWNKDSNYLGADLHLAIHSNASEEHNVYGIETWIHAEDSKTYTLANLIQDGLMSIYYNPDDANSNRGVKYANGALGEVNDNYLPFGILVEIAHHDYETDASWIMENKKLIGYNIADTILKYYQIIE